MEFGQSIEIFTPAPEIDEHVILNANNGLSLPVRQICAIGPIYIEGCKAGDVIRIQIDEIELARFGKSWHGSWVGVLKQNGENAALFHSKVYGSKVEIIGIKSNTQPMVGTVGVTPKKPMPCLIPGSHGGNMDIPTLGVGTSISFRAQVDGALIAIGDVHALMGEGELMGTGIETGSRVVVSVFRAAEISDSSWPLHETKTDYAVVVSDDSLDSSIQIATHAAISFVTNMTGQSYSSSYAFVGLFCNLRIAQVVNPAPTVLIRIPKGVLEQFRKQERSEA
jgi:amidase